MYIKGIRTMFTKPGYQKTAEDFARERKALETETRKILAKIATDKKAHGGLSRAQRSPVRPWCYANSNFGMGM